MKLAIFAALVSFEVAVAFTISPCTKSVAFSTALADIKSGSGSGGDDATLENLAVSALQKMIDSANNKRTIDTPGDERSLLCVPEKTELFEGKSCTDDEIEAFTDTNIVPEIDIRKYFSKPHYRDEVEKDLVRLLRITTRALALDAEYDEQKVENLAAKFKAAADSESPENKAFLEASPMDWSSYYPIDLSDAFSGIPLDDNEKKIIRSIPIVAPYMHSSPEEDPPDHLTAQCIGLIGFEPSLQYESNAPDYSGINVAAAFLKNPSLKSAFGETEWVTIANWSTYDIDLSGWTLSTGKGEISLTGTIEIGAGERVSTEDGEGNSIQLGLNGGTLTLRDVNGIVVDKKSWPVVKASVVCGFPYN